MRSRDEKDALDYIKDESQDEDGTFFLPVRENAGPDSFGLSFFGFLGAIAGAAATPLAPGLGGALLCAGYCFVAFSMRHLQSRFLKSLRFGFAIMALAGATLAAARYNWPSATFSFVTFFSQRHLAFGTAVAAPWVIAIIRYILIAIPRRPFARR